MSSEPSLNQDLESSEVTLSQGVKSSEPALSQVAESSETTLNKGVKSYEPTLNQGLESTEATFNQDVESSSPGSSNQPSWDQLQFLPNDLKTTKAFVDEEEDKKTYAKLLPR